MVTAARIVRLIVALLCGVVLTAHASEQCQRLVARGQLAWAGGHIEDAEALFSAAVASDPSDPEAHYGLGIALARQGRWPEAEQALQRVLALRPGDAAAARALEQARSRKHDDTAPASVTSPTADATRIWSLRGRAGVGYDSNVPLLSHGTPGRKQDAVFQLSAGVSVTPIASGRMRLQLDYDFDQTLHPRLQDYDVRSHRAAGTFSVSLTDGLWASLYGGVEHYSLGSSQYLWDPFVEPILSYEWTDVGLSQLYYRHGEPDYFHRPFRGVRDGQTNGTGILQVLYLGDPSRRLSFGYSYEDERPRHRAGNDYQRGSHDASIGLQLPVGWNTTVTASYDYRRDGYRKPNSVAGFRTSRTDDAHIYGVGLARPLTDAVTLRLDYEGTANQSNIGYFDYRRQLVVLAIEAKY